MFWENAPDYRTSRTLDWLNDACEARLGEQDRHNGEITYRALMSPVSISPSPSFFRKHPFTRAKRVRLRPGKKEYRGKFPISLLLTTGLDITDDKGTTQKIIPPYVLLGARRFGRYPAVGKHTWDEISLDAAKPATKTSGAQAKQATDYLHCRILISTVAVDVKFATKLEADFLREFLESKPKPKRVAAKTGS